MAGAHEPQGRKKEKKEMPAIGESAMREAVVVMEEWWAAVVRGQRAVEWWRTPVKKVTRRTQAESARCRLLARKEPWGCKNSPPPANTCGGRAQVECTEGHDGIAMDSSLILRHAECILTRVESDLMLAALTHLGPPRSRLCSAPT